MLNIIIMEMNITHKNVENENDEKRDFFFFFLIWECVCARTGDCSATVAVDGMARPTSSVSVGPFNRHQLSLSNLSSAKLL